MTSLWMENGRKTRAGVVVAPVNFMLREDIILTDVGEQAASGEVTILRKGKEFFTYDEAIALQEQGEFPAGWRLPTVEEAQALMKEFPPKDADSPSSNIVDELRLELCGYVYPNMNEYNEDPVYYGFATNRILEGRIWLDDAEKDGFYGLWVRRFKEPIIQTFYHGSGANIRLVHEI